MEQKFIERLTDEQILDFLYQNVGRRILVSLYRCKKYISATINFDYPNYFDCHYELAVILYDYDVGGYVSKEKWLKYMYGIFGEEYKNAYLKDCVKALE